jgi:2-keto-4-pentenoate hydratase/2-oxohepta-3-ene-1,7-dioic acid hydratase in catechol pathway
MKIGRYKGPDGSERLGIVTGEVKTLKVLDLQAASTAQGRRAPVTMNEFIDGAEKARTDAYGTIEWALREGQSSWYLEEREVPWMMPVQVRNCIAGGRNFKAHREETLEYWTKQGAKLHSDIPMGFIKLASSMVPTRTDVRRPQETQWFDFEVEATAVIGYPAERVSEKDALKSVFGYTLLNDLSARELQRQEMANQSILLGKNFRGLGPLGPWIVTADEIPDPAVIDISLTVNGQPRQKASCRDMIFSFAGLISHWSRLGLDRGDLITTGSPDGVAIARPDPMAFYLQPGDIVRAESPQIGTLETCIV